LTGCTLLFAAVAGLASPAVGERSSKLDGMPATVEAQWGLFRDRSPATAEAPPVPRRWLAQAGPAPTVPGARQEEVVFDSNGFRLYGCMQTPPGVGPFPVIIYNHGSERSPGRCSPPELAQAYVQHGYAFFSFHRHGHGQSPGEYIGDLQQKIAAQVTNPVLRGQKIVALQDAYNRDVVGAVAWLKTRPEIDPARMAMTGVRSDSMRLRGQRLIQNVAPRPPNIHQGTHENLALESRCIP
jgi:hypothetical protein